MQTLSPQTFTECKQRNPYAGDTITCKGYVHSLKIVLSDGFTRYDDGIVCDAHTCRDIYNLQKTRIADLRLKQ